MFRKGDADICHFLLFFAEEQDTLVDKEHIDIFVHPHQINQKEAPLILIDATGRILILQATTASDTSV